MGRIILSVLVGILILGGFGLTDAFAGDAEITLKAQGQPFKELVEEIDNVETSNFNIDSFFDVFYEFILNPDRCESSFLPRVNEDLSGTDCVEANERNFPVDSFFDVFFDVEARSTDNEDTLRTVQTEIVALQALHEESTSTTDYFLKIEGIDGESTDNEHKDWIIIESMSSPLSSSVGAERSRGDVILGDLFVVKELDKSTPLLGEAITKGGHFDKVKIDLVRTVADGSRATYYQYELKNVLVTSYNIGGSGGEDKLTENITLNFEEVKVAYIEFDDDGNNKGTVEATWKIEEGTS